jgi:hypothetical protein
VYKSDEGASVVENLENNVMRYRIADYTVQPRSELEGFGKKYGYSRLESVRIWVVGGSDEDEIVRMRIHRTRRGLKDLDIGLLGLGSMNCHVRPMEGGLLKRSRKRAVTATLNRLASVNGCVDVFFAYSAGKMETLSAQVR